MMQRILIPFCLSLFSLISFSQKLYIAENGAQHIQRSDGDGSNLELINTAGQVGPIRDIVIDEQRSTAFWIEINPPNAQVKKARLEPGSGTVQLGTVSNYIQVPSTSNNFQSLAIDPNTRELLVSNNGGIFKISLDLTSTTTVLPGSFITGFSFISGFDLDLVNSKIYFIRPITTRELWIANLDGTGQASIDNNSEALDVAVDPVGGKLYHSSSGFSPNSGRIVSRDLVTGANSVSIVTNLSTNIRGIAIDPANGLIYWADGTSAVGRANLDGSGNVDIVPGLNAPFDVAIDFSTTTPPKLYWTEGSLQEIHRMNTDGSDFERYYFGGFSPYPTGIAIDPNARMIFWTDGQYNNIKRGPIGETDFDNPEEILDYPDASPGMQGLDIDPDNTMIYFADVDNGRIQRADYSNPLPLTGSDIITIGNPYGVELDLINGKIYYTANDLAAVNTGTLYRANLDGTGQETLISQNIANHKGLCTM